MKKKIIIIIIVILVILTAVLIIPDSKNTKLPLSLVNISVPGESVSGDIIPMGPTVYYGYRAETYKLIVPENRNVTGSRLIAIPVIKILAQNSPKEPVLHLEGGPGISNMRFKEFGKIIENHDIILVGYRGVDGSVILRCNNVMNSLKEAVKSDLLGKESLLSFQEAAKIDYDYLTSTGIDLNGYTMVEVIDDMETARKALGYGKINLLGESYGTRLAQIYSLRYGDSIKRSMMIGVNPPGHFLFSPDETDRIISYYGELYTGGEDLSIVTKRVMNNIPEKWLWFPINKGSVQSGLFMALFHTEGTINSALAFEAILQADKGDYSGLAFMSLLGKLIFPTASNWGDLFSKAASADGNLVTDINNQFGNENSILGAPISRLHWSAAAGWPVNLIEEKYRIPNYIDVETLLVSGNLDVSTPAKFAHNELLPYLTGGKEVILSDFGHTGDFYSKQPEAAVQFIASYFDNGEVRDDLFEYQPFSFKTGTTFGTIMKVITALFVVLPIILSVLLLVLINKIRGKKTRKDLTTKSEVL